MITSVQAGNLPALECPPSDLSADANPTLTEVVCCAVYGAPLKPGGNAGSLRSMLEPRWRENGLLWQDMDGPLWLYPHLSLMARGKEWSFENQTLDENEEITLRYFAAARRWLTRLRRLGFAFGLPPVLADKVIILANMSDEQAATFALNACQQIEEAEKILNQHSEEFYQRLNEFIVAGSVELKAIPVNARTGQWVARDICSPPHQSIPKDYFELPLCHNLFDNNLEVDRYGDDDQLALDAIFDRIERENDNALVRWEDVKVPLEAASELLKKSTQLHKTTIATENKCIDWMVGKIEESPEAPIKTKLEYYREACGEFKHLGSRFNAKPSRSFDRAWSAALEKKEFPGTWGDAGRPKKSPR